MKGVIACILLLAGSVLYGQETTSLPIAKGRAYYQGFFDLGYAAAITPANANGFRANFIHGVGFSNRFFVGAGPGIRAHKNMRTFPILVDFRYGDLSKKTAFYFAAGGGVTVGSINSFAYNGPAGHAEFGVRFNNERSGGFYITLGYESYSAEILQETGGTFLFWRPEIAQIQAVTFGIGFSFL